ncbi:AAA domain-containing protein [Paraclostridium bifermentans]|uniref:DEAD/DEAH box helicase family protein n=1 Tax=Paraclostridium bifermentans TaxID=1490 RepID=UPI001F3A0C0A|nr:ATP-binding protein [Paraclostridium bifermentans]MCE9675731.1 AAA domain-containing protein [Paraclostridium bifermentans]
MEEELLEYIQFQYGYKNRNHIEKSNESFFELLLNKKEEAESITYIRYNGKIFEANFNEYTGIVIIQKNVFDEKKIQSINKKYNSKKYEVKEIEKLYTGFELSNLDYVNSKNITIQRNKNGFYINPEIKIENNKAIILKDNEVIGKVNDARSTTLLKSINKHKDIITLKDSNLFIYTFKHVSKQEGKLKVKVFKDEYNKIGKVVRLIKEGCKFNVNEVWLFLSDDISTSTENSMILVLPEKAYCKCLLDGNELIIKKVINSPRKIRGKSFLLKVNISDLDFEEVDSNSVENEDVIDHDGFNDVVARKSQNTNFINMIKEYEQTEIEILNEIKVQCKELRYTSLEQDKLIISKNYIANLEQWSNKRGISICFKEGNKEYILGSLKEVGEDYIKIDFKDDMIRNSIPRKGGVVGVSLFGDEIIHKRRESAINILENNSAAMENLSYILNGEHDLETFLYEYLLEKYEIGTLSDMQVDAIEGALNTPDIFLIQGPPGAGKTTVIRNIVKKILENKEEVLITSFQNLAVDNVLDGFLKSDIIPYRFGDEDNPVMQRICSDISEEINLSLKNNISKDKEEEIQEYRDSITAFRGKILSAEDNTLLCNEIENALKQIKNFEGINSSYISLNNIYEEIANQPKEKSFEFDISKVKEMMPIEFGYDFEILEKFEKTEIYLKNINKSLNSKVINYVIEKLEYLQDMETLFTLEDKEYQKIKLWIFDELRLVKSNNSDEIDIIDISMRAASILDDILENIPEYIEDDKYKIIKEFHDKISNNPILLEDILKKYPDIRGTTCQKTGGGKFNDATKGINYNYVIVDEAGRANPLDLLIPLVKGYKVILVGDHKQLPHMIESHVESKIKENGDFNEELYEKYIKESLFGRLFNQLPGNRKVMLDTQYRMTKEIGDLVSRLFYNNKLKTGTKIINDTNFYTNRSLVSINIKGNQKKTHGGSWINNHEVDEVIEKLIELDKLQDGFDKKISVGIISFYKAQVEQIKFKVNKLIFKNIEVDVGTVDAYQGLEKDIIFISSVRTDGIGFIANPNRLNVSLSRAKKLVVIFGDLANLNSNELFKEIISCCWDGGEI